jgi:tripartite-type tricarboxylate transporter receptor subunit TctC
MHSQPAETLVMTPSRSTFFRGLLGAAAALLLGLPAAAQQPEGTLRIVVGYPAGATSDSLARVVAEALGKRLKQTVIVDNKAGAGGRIANELVKAAPADGNTLLMTPVATMSIFPHSYAGELRYDPFKDFAPVAHLANFQLGLGVSATVPARTLAEFVALVKADPGKYGFYASAASGSLPHFFGVMFAREAGIELTHVPYKGTAPAMQALASGEVVAASTVAADIRAVVQAGKARLLAVAGEQRDPTFPDVPTFRELGYKNLVALPWYALFAPAGTPKATLDQLSAAIAQVIVLPEVRERLTALGLTVAHSSGEQLAARERAYHQTWAKIIKDSGFQPQ